MSEQRPTPGYSNFPFPTNANPVKRREIERLDEMYEAAEKGSQGSAGDIGLGYDFDENVSLSGSTEVSIHAQITGPYQVNTPYYLFVETTVLGGLSSSISEEVQAGSETPLVGGITNLVGSSVAVERNGNIQVPKGVYVDLFLGDDGITWFFNYSSIEKPGTSTISTRPTTQPLTNPVLTGRLYKNSQQVPMPSNISTLNTMTPTYAVYLDPASPFLTLSSIAMGSNSESGQVGLPILLGSGTISFILGNFSVSPDPSGPNLFIGPGTATVLGIGFTRADTGQEVAIDNSDDATSGMQTDQSVKFPIAPAAGLIGYLNNVVYQEQQESDANGNPIYLHSFTGLSAVALQGALFVFNGIDPGVQTGPDYFLLGSGLIYLTAIYPGAADATMVAGALVLYTSGDSTINIVDNPMGGGTF